MFAIKQTQIVVLFIAMAAVFAGFGTANAAYSQRGLLTIQGRIVNAAGQPLADAWVFTKGSRRLSTYSQGDGHFALSIPSATLRELIRAPFTLEVHARHKSWNILHATGPALLALELYVESDSLGGLELNIRSNDPKVATVIAQAAVLDANPRVVIEADFEGRPGLQHNDRNVRLVAVEKVRLAGLTLEEVDPVTSRRLESTSKRSKRWSPVPARAEADVPRTPAAAVAETPADIRNDEPTALTMAQWEQDDPTIDVEQKITPAVSRNVTPVPAKKLREAAVTIPMDRTPSRAQASPHDTARHDLPLANREGTVASAAAPLDARPSAGAAATQALPNDIDDAPRTTSALAASPAAVGQSQRLIPERPRWMPKRTTAESCECMIRGTVETARPLSRGMKVTVWVEGSADAQADVELFMGSPRGFQLGPVACGDHRVLFSPASKQRYRLEPGGDRIECRGGTHHVRLVLIEDNSVR